MTQMGELEICALSGRVGIYVWSLFIFPLVSAALIKLGSQGGSDLAAPFCKAPWILEVITLGSLLPLCS